MAFINTLYNLWPNGDEKVPGLRDGVAATAPAVFAKYGINSPLLVAHVMAQISHECGAGHDVVENLNYTAGRMTEVWPSRFPSVASAAPYAGNPRGLANKVYGGRMGNVGPDDGWNFRGRGGSQCTGRSGYARLAKATGLDLLNHPDMVTDPKYFLDCAVGDFIACGCLPYAKADDLVQTSAMLNVGHTVENASTVVGLAERKRWLAKWKAANVAVPVATAPAPAPVRPIPAPPDIKLPPPGVVKPDLAPTFWGRVSDLFKPKGH